MVRDRRPEKIRSLDDLIEKEATDKQKDVLDVIDDNPEMPFNEMAEIGPEEYDTGDYTGSHYSDVFYKYFGPEDDRLERSFQEIKGRYGTLKNYYERRYELDEIAEENSTEASETEQMELNAEELLSDKRVDLPPDVYDALKTGIEIGFDQGVNKGYELGLEHGRKNQERNTRKN